MWFGKNVVANFLVITLASTIGMKESCAFTIVPSSPSTTINIIQSKQHNRHYQRTYKISRGNTLNVIPAESSFADTFVRDHYFLINGIVAGIVLTLGTGVNRNVQANQAWEERVKEAQASRIAKGGKEESMVNELDLRAELASMSPSMYGPEAKARRKRRGNSGESESEIERDEYEMSDEDIEEFQKQYGVQYDPYYDEVYYEDELPQDVEFSTDPYFGDRIYDNGETFFKDGDKFYRKGAKPRGGGSEFLSSWRK